VKQAQAEHQTGQLIDMKLRQIYENYIGNKLREQLQSSGYFGRPGLHSDKPYEASSGHDSGSRISGYSNLTTGVPRKIRHRKFLGLSNRPGSITL
jgi:hypothetical protein